MPDINPKELALILYKLSAENNAILRALVTLIAEQSAKIGYIQSAVRATLTQEVSDHIIKTFTDDRDRLINDIARIMPSIESKTLKRIADWMEKEDGSLDGSLFDYLDLNTN